MLMNDIFHKMIQKNRNYFTFFLHTLLCNIFVFFMFCFFSLTVVAGKEIDALESEKKYYDDKNVCIAIYDRLKPFENNITSLENGTVVYLWKNGLLQLPEKNIAIPWSLIQLIKMMPLEKESLFIKKIIFLYAANIKQKIILLFNFFYKIEHLDSFLRHDDKDIKYIMKHVYYVDIVEVFHFCGFPSVEVVEHVKTWINLEKGYTLDWLWKNLSLNFKEQGVPNKHVFFSLMAEMGKEIRLSSQSLTYLYELKKCWDLGNNIPKHRNKDDWWMIKIKLSSFFLFLSSKDINITKVFFDKMKNFDFEKMVFFCDKCKCFYENREERWSISSFFLKYDYAVKKFLNYNNEDIKFIATHPFYKNILALYRRREFPPAKMVREVDTWVNTREGMTPEWIWNNLVLNFKNLRIPGKEVFFSRVAHVARDVNFIRYYRIIEYGLKQEKRDDDNKKCNDLYNEKNIDKANELLVLLARKKICNVLLFINIILELDADKSTDFCDKIIWFYSKAKETKSIVPIFLGSMEQVYLFLDNSREDIEFIAQHSAYPFIVEVYSGINFPVASCVKEADTWKHFVGGEDVSLITLWGLLAKNYRHCRMPTKEEFLLRCFKLLYNSHDIHEKKQKEERTVQKIKLHHDNALSLPLLNIDILKDVKSKDKVDNGEKFHDLCSEKSKEKIGELLMFLIEKRIENIVLVVKLLFKNLLKFDDNTIADFCDKMICFYSNTEEKRSLVPSFLNSMKKVNIFLTNNHENIEFIAQHPYYSDIYKIYFGVYFPSASCVKKIDTWENIVENITLISLWKLLAKMFPGSGVPKKGTFLFDWFTLLDKQHRICEKNKKNEFTLQEKKLNFDNAVESLSFNTDMLNDPKRKNKITNDPKEICSEVWNEKIMDTIDELLTLLIGKNIEDIPSFIDVILKITNCQIIVFCNKVMLFYKNNGEKRSIVIIFLNSMEKVTWFIHNKNKKDIKLIAQHPHYVHISEVYRGVNFPDAFDIEKIELWKKMVQDVTSMFLWKLLAQVFVGYGMPSQEIFFFFYSCYDVFYKKNQICEKK